MKSSNGNIFHVTGHLCNSPVPGEFPAKRPVTRSFDVFFDLRLNKQLSKQSWGWWFETLSRPLWRHCNAMSSIPHSPFLLNMSAVYSLRIRYIWHVSHESKLAAMDRCSWLCTVEMNMNSLCSPHAAKRIINKTPYRVIHHGSVWLVWPLIQFSCCHNNIQMIYLSSNMPTKWKLYKLDVQPKLTYEVELRCFLWSAS